MSLWKGAQRDLVEAAGALLAFQGLSPFTATAAQRTGALLWAEQQDNLRYIVLFLKALGKKGKRGRTRGRHR